MPNQGGGGAAKRRGIKPECAAYARRYVELVEALLAQGVEESLAREEARWTATWIYMGETDHSVKKCPACGTQLEP